LRVLVPTILAGLLLPAVALAREGVVRSFWKDGLIWSELEGGRTVRGGTVAGIGMVEWQLGVPFVRTTTGMSGRPIRWPSRCVTLSPDVSGLVDLTPDQVYAIIDRSMANWMTPTRDCSDLVIQRGPTYSGEVGFDSISRIKLRQTRWCRPAMGNDAEVCHNPFAPGLTRVFFIDSPSRSDDGVILDADVELNGVNFAFATGCEGTCQTQGTGSPQDLENTMTHELGHALGLGHTCWDPDDVPIQPVDDTGTPIPACEPEASLPQTIRDATMYPYGQPTEIIKRSIEPNEHDAICTIYPTTAADDACEAPRPEGGCAVVTRSEAPRWPLFFLLLLVPVSWKVRRWFARSSV
jgi:hypothetical protein